jgi:D-alanine-D-alanine ligase
LSKKSSRKKINVAILFGGKSGEHEVSIVSATSIYHALDKDKYNVTLIGIDKTGRWLVPDQAQILAHSENPRLIKLNKQKATVGLVPFESKKQLVPIGGAGRSPKSGPPALARGIDVILPVLHGTYGEDGTIQGLLELANIPYAGSGVLGSALGMDKEVSRKLLRDAGIPVVPFKVVHRHEFDKNAKNILDDAAKSFQFPYFVKPANMGSSVGVNKVKTPGEAMSKFKDAFLYDTKILIERGVDARELECAVLGNHEPKASCIGEIVPRHEFYSYEAKYIDDNGADLLIPAAQLPAKMAEQIQKYSVEAFKVLQCRGMARVDFFLDRKTGELYLNEINTIPGFTKISMYPKLWDATGLPYARLLDELIALALEIHAEKASLKTTYEPRS